MKGVSIDKTETGWVKGAVITKEVFYLGSWREVKSRRRKVEGLGTTRYFRLRLTRDICVVLTEEETIGVSLSGGHTTKPYLSLYARCFQKIDGHYKSIYLKATWAQTPTGVLLCVPSIDARTVYNKLCKENPL